MRVRVDLETVVVSSVCENSPRAYYMHMCSNVRMYTEWLCAVIGLVCVIHLHTLFACT